MEKKSAISDDPLLSRLFEIEIEKLYLMLLRIEQLTTFALGAVVGLWVAGYFDSEYGFVGLLLAPIAWLTARRIKSDPSVLMPRLITRWVLLERKDKGPHGAWLAARKMFRSPAKAIRFAKRNNIKLKDFSVMWVNGFENYRACRARRESPSRSELIAERKRLLRELEEDESSPMGSEDRNDR